MNKKLIGGVTAVLAGIGLYRLISKRQNNETLTAGQWTTVDMPDLTGKVIVVTGANSGIGLEAAKEFAQKGASTILACRSLDKAEAALAEIRAEIPDARAEIMPLDLANQASVQQFAAAFKAKYDRLDVLVNNAGIMMVPYGTTDDGFERQLGTNHLGHFALTGLLFDLLVQTPEARVVNVSSAAHHRGSMDFDNLMYEQGEGYTPMGAYGRSKLANLLFTYELQRRFTALGAKARATAAHPGISQTNLMGHMADRWYYKPVMLAAPLFLQSAAMGALPTIRAAVDPAVQGGEYFGPDGPGERGGYPVAVESSDNAHNEADARRLWQVSEELTGVKFGQIEGVHGR
ncbi:MAG: SDR family oxidoreductase [Chloroflexi bacterium]|nr:SDR family oxidoreductase [Chloroflexota bacterium]MBP7041984.1 SDR family oxidoreductase [Chloroflexota bacterium]